MIRSAADMLRAMRGSNPKFRGICLWHGASLLDGAPIAAIATKIVSKSKNGKTGHMVQTFIIRTDVAPHTALKTGQDESVCGNCKHRPILVKAARELAKRLRLTPPEAAPCYVQVAKSVLSVFNAFGRGRYAMPGVDYDPKILPDVFAGMPFRMGSYGEPTAAPYQIWRAATLKAAFVNGYVHQWQDPRFAIFKTLCMASVDSAEERDLAHSMGWRTFHVLSSLAPLDRSVELPCPASKESGYRTSCDKCKGCGGLSAKAKVSFAIIPHGIGVQRLAA